MAKIYKANGEVLDIEPKNGKNFELKESQAIVGGLIEVIELDDPEMSLMVINEEGKLMDLDLNEKATAIFRKNYITSDYIVGDAIICKSSEIL